MWPPPCAARGSAQSASTAVQASTRFNIVVTSWFETLNNECTPVYHTLRPAVPDWGILGAMNEAYRALLEAFGRGWERGDVDAIASVFTPDAVFLATPFSDKSVGIDPIRDYWKDVPWNQAELIFGRGRLF